MIVGDLRPGFDRFLAGFAGELRRFTHEKEATMHGSDLLTPREADAMRVLWDQGSATVKEARTSDAFEDGTPYTSVLSIFQTLEQKGHVRHDLEGRSYRYYPVTTRLQATEEAVEHVSEHYFGGDTEATALYELGVTDG